MTRPLLSLFALCLGGCDLQAFFLTPKTAFDAGALATAPDYGQPAAWAAHPERPDRADLVPPGVSLPPETPLADVFFVHPTAWFDLEVWNDTLADPKALEVVDQIVMAGEASAFNGCCRVFAPRYRQATIGVFYGDRGDAQQALQVAFDDVDRAFTAFLSSIGERPFVLAGHSQGSQHAMRLLERINADPALRARLVVAYVPGFAHPLSNFETAYPELQPCSLPEQLGCVAAWDTYREGAKVEGSGPMLHWVNGQVQQLGDAPRQCTNPITWRTTAEPSMRVQHRGAVAPVNTGAPVVMRKLMMDEEPLGVFMESLGAPQANLLSVRCEDGVLRAPDVSDLSWPATEVQPGNYHLMDYELFYVDIRDNAKARVQAWADLRAPPVQAAPPE